VREVGRVGEDVFGCSLDLDGVGDPVLLERRGLLTAAGAAARLALENERLQAELRPQLAELRASRVRIVTAGDEERRRLERDPHDGAQQRLLSLGLALQLVRAELGPMRRAPRRCSTRPSQNSVGHLMKA
jgi:signal transduction histidine kinase